MLVALMTGMGMKGTCIYTGEDGSENGWWGMMNYWYHKYDLCNTRTQRSCLFHHGTYNGLKIDRQLRNISRCLMKYLTFGNVLYIRHYIWDSLQGKQYPLVHPGPFKLARWELYSSMELDIFMYEGNEFHKRTPWYRTAWIPYFFCINSGLIQ